MKIRKKCRVVFFILFLLFLSACSGTTIDNISDDFVQNGKRFSAWTVYWDADNGLRELSKIDDKLNSVSVFALYFNYDGSIFVPNDINQKNDSFSKIILKNNISSYISIVNNSIDESGKIVQNDSGVIRKLLSSPDKRNKHINEIIDFAVENDYSGIEIDYEKLEEAVWNDFIVFCEELYQKCLEKNLELRVVLEPKAPLDRYTLPQGPEYVMMAYDLYDSSTEPGPKADINFIRELSEKMNKVIGRKWLAFSTGGFDWSADGEGKAITESEALDIINEYKSLPARDKNSGCLYFYYTDEKGLEHTVWYADGNTFDLWIATAAECGCESISFWRLGGNSASTLGQIKDNF